MLRRLIVGGITLFCVIALVFYGLVMWPLRDPHPSPYLASGFLAIRSARIYASPDDPPIDNATVLVRDGRIVAVGPDVSVPAGARIIPCNRCIVTAGFWNTHVHFTEAKWLLSDWKSAAILNAQHHRYAHQPRVYHGSRCGLRPAAAPCRCAGALNPANCSVRASTQCWGSAVSTPRHSFLSARESLPRYMLHFMPQPAAPAAAARIAERNIAQGADILKLFTGSYVERDRILPHARSWQREAAAAAVA